MGNSPFNSEHYGAYREYMLKLGEDNSLSRNTLKSNLRAAMLGELTPRQQELMRMYYAEQIKMADIAKFFGVRPSTVSRTLKRGRARIRRCLRYGARELLHDIEEK